MYIVHLIASLILDYNKSNGHIQVIRPIPHKTTPAIAIPLGWVALILSTNDTIAKTKPTMQIIIDKKLQNGKNEKITPIIPKTKAAISIFPPKNYNYF